MELGEIWFGRSGSVYEGIQARIESITTRNVQVSFNQVVQVKGMRLLGEVMSKGKFRCSTIEFVQMKKGPCWAFLFIAAFLE